MNRAAARPPRSLPTNNQFFLLCGIPHKRKNWLFSGHPRGAEASATIYSLIETAKANGLQAYHYLRFLFDKLPLVQNEDDYKVTV